MPWLMGTAGAETEVSADENPELSQAVLYSD